MSDDGSEKTPAERRKPRQRVLLTGLIAYPDLSVSFRCAIRERSSEGGAKLRLTDGAVAPAQFWLIDVAEGVAFDASVVWREMPDLGVSLGAPIHLKKPDPDDLNQRRLRALWIEVSPRRDI
jgi:hypothetical protein